MIGYSIHFALFAFGLLLLALPVGASAQLYIRLQGFYNADRPKGTGDWLLRFQVQFLFPK